MLIFFYKKNNIIIINNIIIYNINWLNSTILEYVDSKESR